MALAGLEEKVIIVTGAMGAIGRAVVERLLGEGARVAMVDINKAAIDKALAQIAEPDRVLGITADVSTVAGVDKYMDAAIAHFGRIDGLHNNAGIERPVKAIMDTSPEEFDQLMAVNLRGVFLGLRRMFQVFVEQATGGVILNTASVLGLRGRQFMAPYAASKAAVISLTKSAAIEGAEHGIRVNALLPGPVAGRMIDDIARSLMPEDVQGAMELISNSVPFKRLGQPAEIAALAAWLLSDECPYATGGTYTADGGDAAT